MRDYLLLYVNGKQHRVGGGDAFIPLSSYLRYRQQATGTKIVCEEGDCGACTVLIGNLENGEIKYKPINSCIQYMYQLDCSHIITVEGLKVDGQLNEVQQSMVEHQGAQCGYCTPGFVVAMCSLFDQKSCVNQQDVKDALTGNLCRCTGYEPIIKAGLAVDPEKTVKLPELYPGREMLADFKSHAKLPITIESDERIFFNPVDAVSAADFKRKHKDTVIVSGGTDICVQCNKRGFEPAVVMSLSNVPGLTELKVDKGIVHVGGKVTLQDLEDYLKDLVPEFYQILKVFGSPQIKYAGTLAGNIANASPIADTLPFLFVMDATVEFWGVAGKRAVKIRSLYKGYKDLDKKPDEFIAEIRIPLPGKNDILRLYKVSKRKNLDISTFTAAFLMRRGAGGIIENMQIAYGGVAPVVLMLPKTAAFLTGKEFTLELFQAAGDVAIQEIKPISDVRGSEVFRNQLAQTILEKFYYETADDRVVACP